jgi:riboflavin kinase / FMN adenylyltransferase
MRVVQGLEAWEADAERRPVVASVGNFDGVHRGHQRLLTAVREQARGAGWEAVAVTFEPHPSRILRPEAAPRLITPLAEKLRRMEDCGVDAVLVLAFGRDLSLWTPLEFVERVVVRGLRARALHEGVNFRFGRRHEGTVGLLRQLGAEFGFEVREHAAVEARGEMVSSSRIRELVAAGKVERARHLLGRTFSVRGPIARGRGVGRQRTVPTLNLQHYEELLPGAGVYLTQVTLGGRRFAAVTNVGVRPTFGPGPLTVESYILHPPAAGLEAGLGEEIEVAFLHSLRDELRFDSVEALRTQIQSDVAVAEVFFRRLSGYNRE